MLFLWVSSFAYSKDRTFNNPYPARESTQKIYYTSFLEQPKTLDIARAYSNDESLVISQIYEPLLQRITKIYF